jgi:hypothetical protein
MVLQASHRALERSQYDFDFQSAPLREHRFYAHAESDEQLQRVSSARLRKEFEEFYKFKYYDAEKSEWRLKRLKGFTGDYYWSGGTLIFLLRGPEIPFFALRASQICNGVPIMYQTITLDGQETPPRFFFSGEELFEGMDAELAGKFSELNKKQWGIIRSAVRSPLEFP